MKKLLFLFICFSFWNLNAQQPLRYSGQEKEVSITKPTTELDYTPSKSSFSKTSSSISTPIGQAPNGFGCAFGPLKPLSAHEGLNSIAMIHRSDFNTNGDNSNGSLRYDISTDGGTTWNTNVGPIYNPAGGTGVYPGPSRYPNAILFNPNGASSASNAFMALWGTTYLNQNNWYGGQLMGTHKLDNSDIKIRVDSSSAEMGYPTVSKAFWKATETTIFGVNMNHNDATSYSDTIMVYKGVWDNTNDSLGFTKTDVYLPLGTNSNGDVVYADFKVAFDLTGQIGYILVIGYSTSYPVYGLYHPIIFKTTDGGNTWSAPQNINLNTLQETISNMTLLKNYQDVDSTWTITDLSTAFDGDITVDKNGNPHIFVNICPAAISTITGNGNTGNEFSIYSGINGMVDIYSTDGGATYKSMIVGSPQSFRGSFGTDPSNPDVTEDNRPHLSRSGDGRYIVYSWFDTDLSIWGGTDNNFPDWWANVYDVDLQSTPIGAINMTDDISNSGVNTFGNVAPEAWGPTNNKLRLHCVNQILDPNTNDFYAPTQMNYLAGDYPLFIGIREEENAHFNISDCFPNPTRSIVSLRLELDFSSDFDLVVTNYLGQIIESRELGKLQLGQHKIEIDASNFASGMYTVTLQSEGVQLSKKFIVE
ncbi:MAG: T9SS type A sorting domain-containing protein [Schleiferiaceae bacterium]|nr:T9SS type A sorting domain-containing protein [Schleiferiaceae bacterium]